MAQCYFLGIDSGSISTDAVIVNAEGRRVAAAVEPTRGDVERAVARATEAVVGEARIADAEIAATVACGYGRYAVKRAAQVMTEISCHARGVHALFPAERFVLDIGGEDAKVIVLDDAGQVADFSMNTKCAAGTGRFLEAVAQRLGYSLPAFIALAKTSTAPVAITSTCTVFAESEVVGLVAAGKPIADIARGVHAAIAQRLHSMLTRIHADTRIVLTGGVAMNPVIADLLHAVYRMTVILPEQPQIVGAFGAALYARKFCGSVK